MDSHEKLFFFSLILSVELAISSSSSLQTPSESALLTFRWGNPQTVLLVVHQSFPLTPQVCYTVNDMNMVLVTIEIKSPHFYV